MSRQIVITKVGASTIVTITDSEAQNEKRVYNKDCNFYQAGEVLVIGKCCPYPELKAEFSELNTLGTATDISSFIDEAIKPVNGFFNTSIVL